MNASSGESMRHCPPSWTRLNVDEIMESSLRVITPSLFTEATAGTVTVAVNVPDPSSPLIEIDGDEAVS